MTQPQTSKSEDRGFGRAVENVLLLLAGPVYLGTLLPLLPGPWWTGLFSHFRVQYALVLLLALVVARKRRWLRIWVGALLLWNLVPIVGLSLGSPRVPTQAGDTTVLAANLLAENDDVAALLAVIEEESPDVIALLEYTPRWQASVAPLRQQYPHSIEDVRSDNFGIALFSREPLAGGIVEYGTAGMPSILGVLPSGLTVLATHPPPPVGSAYAAHRDSQFDAIAEAAAEIDRVVVIGDFNATGFSRSFHSLQQKGNLRNAARSWAPTWPTHFPPLWIPLDHALVSDGVEVSGFRVADHVGSDHYPIVVRVR